MRKTKSSRNQWPDKFDQQAQGKLEEHMRKQGWSEFDVKEETEERTASDQSSEDDDPS